MAKPRKSPPKIPPVTAGAGAFFVQPGQAAGELELHVAGTPGEKSTLVCRLKDLAPGIGLEDLLEMLNAPLARPDDSTAALAAKLDQAGQESALWRRKFEALSGAVKAFRDKLTKNLLVLESVKTQ